MLALPLTVLLLGVPPPPAVEAWAEKACPVSKQTPDSNVEMKLGQKRRATCLREAMDRAHERLVLKRARGPAARPWMALHADTVEWMTQACAALEEANWVDVSTRERSIGTGYGFTESQCLQRSFASRGYCVEAWERAEDKALARVLPSLASSAHEARASLERYRERVHQAAAQTPAPASERRARELSREDWGAWGERLERVAAGPEALAQRQCELLARPGPACVQPLADALSAPLDFSESLGNPDARPDPAR